MKNLNSITVIGNLTKDVKQGKTKNGSDVTTFNVASANSMNGTNFYAVNVYGAFGDTCAKYLGKGSKVCVNGDLIISTYDANGKVYTNIVINAKDVFFLSTKEPQNAILTQEEPIGAQSETREDLPF